MELFVILIMIFDLLISLWNAYAAGYNTVVLERNREIKFHDFFQISNSFTLVLAFAGASYSLSFFFSWIAQSLGYISSDVTLLIASYSFLVFGTLIVFSGIMITIHSILVAYLRRDFWSIFISIYNIFASLWNLYVYFSSFRYIKEIADKYGGDRDNRQRAIIILILAAFIGLILVYSFYKQGKKKAEREIGDRMI